ncbi:MAG TPA: PA0069 family radical SAM protein [Vitreimonas sp.]|uniref:PA0069 family radical SAM protein n=1 Tax=Vitreimonas sp. TaxID=3069702 RepID=UPI002D287CBA|nr:PA0069 family radical SAM protein [Vitreimonas sp.]HYD88167.1 PA0069 family radical SAM protein [Vitreimonas sp.]
MSRDPLHGRGARTNASGRYERFAREAFDDGWTTEESQPLETIVTPELAKTIISTNQSPDISFDQSINPYRGCEHGCIYCYARPNHAYVGLSPGLDFETKLFVKANAAELLEQELAKPNYRPRTIMMGGVTDIYQPIERGYGVTRSILKVMEKWRHPVALITKSQLVIRDIDILARLAERGLAKAAVSVTTLDRRIARVMEPRAAAPHRRIEAIRMLADAGVPVTVMVAPIVPAINDREIESILEECAKAGARSAGYVVLRLPLEIKDLFREWLAQHFPDRATRVMTLVRQMRGGRDYDPEWGKRQKGEGPYAKLIADRFAAALRRFGLDKPTLALDHTQFRRPIEAGGQPDLFAAND